MQDMVINVPDTYRQSAQASKEVVQPSYVLRCLETKFNQIKLIKRPGGRSFYRPEDINLLIKIKNFLRQDGLSIKQVNEKLSDPQPIDNNAINSTNKLTEILDKETSTKSIKNEEILKKLNQILETLS